MTDRLWTPTAHLLMVTVSEETLEQLLVGVDKPARYVGGEVNSVAKPNVRLRLALCFPDVYEVAESHIGLKILYHIVNQHPDYAAERVYALWPDLEAKARAAGVPLWSLETRRPLAVFDVVGFTLQYELSYPTLLAMLDHGGVPLHSAARGETHPFVIGGGAGAFNPEPVADFFDAFLLGDGEEALLKILDVVKRGRESGAPRAAILNDLGGLDGVYVPCHYEVDYDGFRVTGIRAKHGTPKASLKSKHGAPRVTRTTIADLDTAPYPTRPIVPNIKPIHDRVAVEIQRGCSQACRFCQAGMITRPTRQRRPETVLALTDASLKSCGANEVGLLSLSAGDYGPINDVLSVFFERYRDDNIAVSLPSMRTETMTPRLAEQVATVRKSGFTFAPEAGSERLRDVINKTNRESDLLNAVRATAQAGWRHLKFYFMIGLPTETDADVQAIIELATRARAAGRTIRPDVNVTVSVSTFVPKPHTAFQWEAQIGVDETVRKQQLLRERLRARGIGFRYHTAEQSFLEGVLSRGDRRLGPSLEAAMRAGARFDAWSEWHDARLWLRVLRTHLEPFGLRPEDYLSERPEEGLLPWDHLDAGILKKFLRRDRAQSYRQATIQDCAFSEHCYACGGCHLGDPYRKKDSVVQLQPVVHRAESAPAPAPAPASASASASEGAPRIRLRFRLAKLGRAYHMSHLDMQQHVLRALRLAALPLEYSNGYNRRPRVSFTPACPTGVASEAEYFDVDCATELLAPTWAERIKPFLPDGLFIMDAETVERGRRSLNDGLRTVTYVVTAPPRMDDQALCDAIARFQLQSHCWVEVARKDRTRQFDVRALVADALVVDCKVRITLHFAAEGSIKITEVLAAIFAWPDLDAVRVRKVDVQFSEEPAPVTSAYDGAAQLLDLTHLLVHASERRKPKADREVVPYAE